MYTEADARFGPDQELVFEWEKITLDIPKEGIVLESGWTITLQTHCGVNQFSSNTQLCPYNTEHELK